MSLSPREGYEFDLEEFKALREEILQKVDTISKLEQIAVGAAAALYAWLATQEVEPERWIWAVPCVFAAVGWAWAVKIGHQAYLAGQYILVLEKRLRPEAFTAEMVYEALPEQVKRKMPPKDAELTNIHGWECFIRIPMIRKRFLDRITHLFWLLFLGVSLWIAFRPVTG